MLVCGVEFSCSITNLKVLLKLFCFHRHTTTSIKLWHGFDNWNTNVKYAEILHTIWSSLYAWCYFINTSIRALMYSKLFHNDGRELLADKKDFWINPHTDVHTVCCLWCKLKWSQAYKKRGCHSTKAGAFKMCPRICLLLPDEFCRNNHLVQHPLREKSWNSMREIILVSWVFLITKQSEGSELWILNWLERCFCRSE